jgi:hypothetical protein
VQCGLPHPGPGPGFHDGPGVREGAPGGPQKSLYYINHSFFIKLIFTSIIQYLRLLKQINEKRLSKSLIYTIAKVFI